MKKFTKLFCGIVGLGFLATGLAGCATVGNIDKAHKNTSADIIYNGTAGTMMNGYLYYGNAFTDIDSLSTDKDYDNSAKLSYLARLNTNIELSANSKDFSPNNVETVSKSIASHENSFMFVLGNYVYYTIPKKEQAKDDDSGKTVHHFDQSVIYRSKLNGDDRKKIYSAPAVIDQIEVLKANGTYYIVMYLDSKIVSISLKNLKETTLAKNVTSVAMPKTYQQNCVGSSLEWNGKIVYAKNIDIKDNSTVSGTELYSVAVSGGNSQLFMRYAQGTTVSLVGRYGDKIFYTASSSSYMIDANTADSVQATDGTVIENGKTISDVYLMSDGTNEFGYIYTVDDSWGYYNARTNKNGRMTLDVSDTTTLFVSDRKLYLQTGTGIYVAELSSAFNSVGNVSVTCSQIVEMTAIKTGLYAYDGTYIYYYAQLEDEETDEEESDEDSTSITDTDANYYLYRVKTTSNVDSNDYQLLSLTQTTSRHS